MMNKKYIIDEETLLNLLEDSAKLDALECGGVDDWVWYGASIKAMLEEYDVSSMEEVAEIDLINFVNDSKAGISLRKGINNG